MTGTDCAIMTCNMSMDNLAEQPIKSEDLFGNQIKHGINWSFTLVLTRNAINLLSTLILARLIIPKDFGLVAMAATTTGFIAVFADLGLSWATIQRKDLKKEQLDNLFWINTATGIFLWLACIAFAGPLSQWFYKEPALLGIIAISGANFFFNGLTVQPSAVLTRKMRFRLITLIETVSVFVAALIGIFLAASGFGYWALISLIVSTSAVRVILLFYFSGYMPGKPQKSPGTLDLLKFGGWLTVSGINFYLARNLDNIVIGHFWGTEELAFYSKAYFLMCLPTMFPVQAIAPVMLPALSALFRNNDNQIEHIYRKYLFSILIFSAPICAGLSLTSTETIKIVFGPQWLPVIPMLSVLAIAGLFQPLYNSVGWLLIAAGKSKEYFFWSLISAIIYIFAFFFGVRWGAFGVAVAFALASGVLLTFPSQYFAHRMARFSFGVTCKTLFFIYLSIGIMALTVLGINEILASYFGWISLLCAKIATGIIVYTLSLFAFVRPLPIESLENFRLFCFSGQRKAKS